jgi:hypothetical protein
MLRAISLHQPYASLMQMGEKTFETRGRQTHVRGDLAICSSMFSTSPKRLTWFTASQAIREALLRHGIRGMNDLPYGKVLCVVDLYGCMKAELIAAAKPFGEEPFGDYGPGRYAWATRTLRVLKEPVPVKGKQGFFFLPADVEAKVRAQL